MEVKGQDGCGSKRPAEDGGRGDGDDGVRTFENDITYGGGSGGGDNEDEDNNEKPCYHGDIGSFWECGRPYLEPTARKGAVGYPSRCADPGCKNPVFVIGRQAKKGEYQVTSTKIVHFCPNALRKEHKCDYAICDPCKTTRQSCATRPKRPRRTMPMVQPGEVYDAANNVVRASS